VKVAWPLTIYYDASCPLCREEMDALAMGDVHARLRLHDISSPDALDRHCHAAGLGRSALMEAIHARDADGAWFRGVPVFELAYAAAGLEGLARLFGHPRLRRLWDRLYPWVARHRQWLSRLRLDRPYGFLVRRAALRARRRAATCVAGVCRIPGEAHPRPE
jgi:predicted DCC family thiol-disulfide oxidoreductase YuxK